MSKISRNDPCPCGSGKKFKKCCRERQEDAARLASATPPSLSEEIGNLQQAAAVKHSLFKTLGVFVLFSTAEGDAWVLEATEMDAVQVAAKGEKVAVEIDETPETIEVNWPYRFAIADKQLVLTAYQDKSVLRLTDAPSQQINAAVKKIRQRIPPELLKSLHLEEEAVPAAA